MIKDAKLGKELVITTENKVGVLANIAKILADHGLNLEGVAGYGQDKEAKIMIVVEDVLRASEALQKAGYKNIKENEVVVVDLENKPGALKVITAKMAAEKIDIPAVRRSAKPGVGLSLAVQFDLRGHGLTLPHNDGDTFFRVFGGHFAWLTFPGLCAGCPLRCTAAGLFV